LTLVGEGLTLVREGLTLVGEGLTLISKRGLRGNLDRVTATVLAWLGGRDRQRLRGAKRRVL
jgi:hypothetical protein